MIPIPFKSALQILPSAKPIHISTRHTLTHDTKSIKETP